MDKLNTLSANPVTDYVRRMHSTIEQDLYKKNVREEKMFMLMNVLNVYAHECSERCSER